MLSLIVVQRLRITRTYPDFVDTVSTALRMRGPALFDLLRKPLIRHHHQDLLVAVTDEPLMSSMAYMEWCKLGYLRKVYLSTPTALRRHMVDEDRTYDAAVVVTPDYTMLGIITPANRSWMVDYTQHWLPRVREKGTMPWSLPEVGTPVIWCYGTTTGQPMPMVLSGVDTVNRQVVLKHPKHKKDVPYSEKTNEYRVPYHHIYPE